MIRAMHTTHLLLCELSRARRLCMTRLGSCHLQSQVSPSVTHVRACFSLQYFPLRTRCASKVPPALDDVRVSRYTRRHRDNLG